MKNIKIIGLLLLCALAIVGCSENSIEVERFGSIMGTVVDDETGDPLEGVIVTTNPGSTTVTTNELGEFSFSNVLVDDYSVQAELDGYQTGFESITVSEDQTAVVIIEMNISNSENSPPSVPELIFPEDGAVDVPLEVAFAWDATDPEEDELTYTLEIRNGSNDEILEFEVVQDTTFTVSNLQLATNYFWQVYVSDETNDPVVSPISEFTTLSNPDNPYLFVKREEGNNVIYSGGEDVEGELNFNLLKLTDESQNSFRPRKDVNTGKVAFLRSVGGETQLFKMNTDGTNVQQLTSSVPVAGFRQEEITYTWSGNGAFLYYPNFDKVYRINNDGTNVTMVYQTPDGSLVSEIEIPRFDQDLLLLKTNNTQGYNVRIFTYRMSSNTEETVVLEGEPGAAGGIDIGANANLVLYSRDTSGSENGSYERFASRMFTYNIQTDTTTQILAGTLAGENDIQSRFSPSEGGVIFTRVEAGQSPSPDIYRLNLGQANSQIQLFTESFMPDWE